MCILCGNDVKKSELFIYQKTLKKLEENLSSEKSRTLQLTEKLQQAESELAQEKAKVFHLIKERNNDQCERYDENVSLHDEVLEQTNFFSIVRDIVERGFRDNPFYTYNKTTYEHIECSDEEVIKKVELNAREAISEIKLDGRLQSLEFERMSKMTDDDGNRYIQISFEANYTKLLPCELHVLMKAGENTFSNAVYIDHNEIHMNRGSKKDWLFIHYHTTNIGRSVNISFSFNFYADDSGEYSAGREHAIRFLHMASNTALMYTWLNVEKRNSVISHYSH